MVGFMGCGLCLEGCGLWAVGLGVGGFTAENCCCEELKVARSLYWGLLPPFDPPCAKCRRHVSTFDLVRSGFRPVEE